MQLILIGQIIISLVIISSVLLQSPQGGIGKGSSVFTHYHTRRGFEKLLFYITIVSAILFSVLALVDIVA